MTAIETVLETYLIGDLEALCKTRVGYPILSTAFAGIELLGALLSAQPFNPNDGRAYFAAYWASHLYPGPKATEQARAIYKLGRHGVAHQFFVKGDIGIMSGEPSHHLTYDGAHLWIDTHVLTADLIASYARVVKPMLLTSAQRATLASRFHEIIDAGKRDSSSANLAGRFPPTPPKPSAMAVISVGTNDITESVKR